MHLFVILPLIIILFLQWQFSSITLAISSQFPYLVYGLLLLTASLASLMRQWHWLFSLALLSSHYVVVQLALQKPVTDPNISALHFMLPIVFTLIMMFLQWKTKPQLLTRLGALNLSVLLFALPTLLLLPLDQLVANLPLPPVFFEKVSSSMLLSWGQLWWISVVATCWLGLLNFYSANAQRWAQFSMWFSIMLFYAFIEQPFMSSWMTIAACIALLISLASQMLQLAYIDELTQLPQRRALLSHLSRLGKKSAVTMLDVDHFKKFNDTYGHDVGDQVLKLLGSVLGSERGMTAYRYGGEEFTLVFRHNDEDVLAEKLEIVRQKVEQYPLVIRQDNRPKNTDQGKQQRGASSNNKVVHITISLGCAIRRPNETTEQLLKRADEALYAAKKAGRNQVAFAK